MLRDLGIKQKTKQKRKTEPLICNFPWDNVDSIYYSAATLEV